MGFPELDPDEPVILESGNVRFNSLSFDAILTNKRIHLTDSRKNVIPSRDIPLAIIRNVENGENAIRDHFLILSLVTGTGEKSQVVLTFARQSGVERKRECNEWAKKLKSFISSASPVIAPSDVPEPDRTPLPQREVPTKVQGSETGIRPANKKIPPARPQRTIIEKSSRVPEPVEVTTLPSGSFCSQCGTRVPLKSTFCSHCGVPFKQPSGRAQEPQPVVTKVPEPVKPPAPKPVVIKVQERPTPQPVVTNVPEPVRPLGSQPFVTKVPDLVRPQGSSACCYEGSGAGSTSGVSACCYEGSGAGSTSGVSACCYKGSGAGSTSGATTCCYEGSGAGSTSGATTCCYEGS